MARLQPIRMVDPGQLTSIANLKVDEGRAYARGLSSVGASIASGLAMVGRKKEAEKDRKQAEKMQASRLQAQLDMETARQTYQTTRDEKDHTRAIELGGLRQEDAMELAKLRETQRINEVRRQQALQDTDAVIYVEGERGKMSSELGQADEAVQSAEKMMEAKRLQAGLISGPQQALTTEEIRRSPPLDTALDPKKRLEWEQQLYAEEIAELTQGTKRVTKLRQSNKALSARLKNARGVEANNLRKQLARDDLRIDNYEAMVQARQRELSIKGVGLGQQAATIEGQELTGQWDEIREQHRVTMEQTVADLYSGGVVNDEAKKQWPPRVTGHMDNLLDTMGKKAAGGRSAGDIVQSFSQWVKTDYEQGVGKSAVDAKKRGEAQDALREDADDSVDLFFVKSGEKGGKRTARVPGFDKDTAQALLSKRLSTEQKKTMIEKIDPKVGQMTDQLERAKFMKKLAAQLPDNLDPMTPEGRRTTGSRDMMIYKVMREAYGW